MRLVRAALLLAFAGCIGQAWAQSGRELIEASLLRHAHAPYVYEELTLLISDSAGQHTVRTLRRYAETDDRVRRNLYVVDTPYELRGVRVQLVRNLRDGARRGPDPAAAAFGSDFSVADLEGEQPGDFRYTPEEGQELDRVPHLVLRAVPRDAGVADATGYGERRIYLRKDNLFVSRIDFLDRTGQLARRETFRDARPDETGAWRAGMILMEDLRENRRSLLKIDRRVHSADYVPAAVFQGAQTRP